MMQQFMLLALVGLTFVIIGSIDGAKRFNVGRFSSIFKSKRGFKATREQLGRALGLRGKDAIVRTRSFKTVTGRVVEHLQQTFGGLKVVGGSIAAHYNPSKGYTGSVSGDLFSSIDADIADPKRCNQKNDTVAEVAFAAETVQASEVLNLSVKKNVYVKNDKATLTYEVNFLFLKGDIPSQPRYFIDACDLSVVDNYNNIQSNAVRMMSNKKENSKRNLPQTTTAPQITQCPQCSNPARGRGGNVKVGEILYGGSNNCLKITVRDTTCILENDYVKVVDLHGSTDIWSWKPPAAAEYNCSSYDDAVNDAYSPALDALYFGTACIQLYHEWFNTKPLDYKPTINIHYSKDYEGAFFTYFFKTVTFGDGNNVFYPLVCLDVAAHEIAHAVTIQNSGLFFYSEMGGIAEAFSDITGEATEYFVNGQNDWVAAADVLKGAGKALRYFEDPHLDGNSYKHVKEYDPWVRNHVHHLSGVFNHAFYKMVAVEGMNMKDAYSCVFRANQIYWGETSKFEQGACGVLSACSDLGFSITKTRRAFKDVGITFAACPEASFMESLSVNETLTGLTVSYSKNPVFIVDPPTDSNKLIVEASASDIKMAVVDDLDSEQSLMSGVGSIVYQLPASSSSSLYLRLSSDSITDTDVNMQVQYD